MTLHLQPVRVRNGSDEEGLLVFDEHQRLVAVLVRLSDLHEEQGLVGRWFLEVEFGRMRGSDNPVFADLDEAQEWIAKRIRVTA